MQHASVANKQTTTTKMVLLCFHYSHGTNANSISVSNQQKQSASVLTHKLGAQVGQTSLYKWWLSLR